MLPQKEFPRWTLTNNATFSLWWEWDSETLWFCSLDLESSKWIGFEAFQMGSVYINSPNIGGPGAYMSSCITKMNNAIRARYPTLFSDGGAVTPTLPPELENADEDTKKVVMELMSLKLVNNQLTR